MRSESMFHFHPPILLIVPAWSVSFVEKFSFSHWIALAPLLKNQVTVMCADVFFNSNQFYLSICWCCFILLCKNYPGYSRVFAFGYDVRTNMAIPPHPPPCPSPTQHTQRQLGLWSGLHCRWTWGELTS